MRVIRLQLSPAQKAKLRKGVAIRLAPKNRAMEGKGIVMMVHPHKYNIITRAFDSGRGKQFKLDDEEMEVNKSPDMVDDDEVKAEMSGSGLFGDIKKGFKKAGKAIKKAPTYYKKHVKNTKAGEMIREGVKTGSKMGIQAGISALSGTPAAPLVPALTAVNAKYGDKGVDMAVKAIGLGLMAGGSLGEAMDVLDDVEEMIKGAGLRAGGDGLRAGGRIGRKEEIREKIRDFRESRGSGKFRDKAEDFKDRAKDRLDDFKGKMGEIRKDFRPPMRTLPVMKGKIRGRVGRGLSLGGANEIIGLDAPPATSYLPPAHSLKKVSLLSGVSR